MPGTQYTTAASTSSVPMVFFQSANRLRFTHAMAWVKRNLFADWKNTIGTLLVLAAVVYWVPGIVSWALLKAEWRPDFSACRALDHTGACWGVITEKYRLILFGRFP